ncbi:MAG: nuclear transport factor 2 family protein [Candidatus Binatia bacterium]|nr:nuclear transport factor 2 family protein [Candidatus Binatia bacterium]
MDDLRQKVEELWDREQIKELTYAYGRCIERQDAEGMAQLFTADGEIDFTSLGRGVHKGHEAIRAFYASTWPLRVKPFFTNHMITFHGAGRASGTCCFENRAVQGEESMIGAGRLHDEYAKVDGVWKFRSRRVELFYFVPLREGWAKVLK